MVTSIHNRKTLFLCFSILTLLPSTNPISFQIKNFEPNDTSIVYEGGATPNAGNVEFNSVDYMCQAGRITYADRVPIWDSKTKQLSDFTTHFSFFIDIQHRNQYGSGFAFFLAPVGSHIPLNSAGGLLGLFNITNIGSPENQIVHVEFDSYWNREWDPGFLHVGINYNSIQSATVTSWNASFHSGDPADVWVSYNSTTKNLTMSWNYQTTSIPYENTSLSLIIDLRNVLPEWVIIGFSASTSNRIERHVLQSWNFDSSLEIHEKKVKNGKIIKITALVAVSGGLMLSAVVAFGFIRRRKQNKRKNTTETVNLTSINDEFERGAGPRKFSYKDLELATSNFSPEKKLGQGGFGAVYKGYIKNSGMSIAVKKISRRSKQGKNEYMTEVKIISQLRHKNLVRLLGWCHDKGEFLLVYEFMPNGSLDSHLFKKKIPLTWNTRYRIGLGLASALLYLHEESEKCVLHRDIKSSNIMLDSSFNVKLGDFGLAQLMEHELDQETTKAAGTPGYMAPEYTKTGKASTESDVYSFGVVALEIATGRKVVDPIEQNDEMITLVAWIWDHYTSGKLSMAVDEILGKDFDAKQIECLMIVGMWCAHPEKDLRPSIRQAINVLKFEAVLPDLSEEIPMPWYHAIKPSVPKANVVITCGEAEMSHSSIGIGR